MVLVISCTFRPIAIAAPTLALLAFHTNVATDRLVPSLTRNLVHMGGRAFLTYPLTAFETKVIELIRSDSNKAFHTHWGFVR